MQTYVHFSKECDQLTQRLLVYCKLQFCIKMMLQLKS